MDDGETSCISPAVAGSGREHELDPLMADRKKGAELGNALRDGTRFNISKGDVYNEKTWNDDCFCGEAFAAISELCTFLGSANPALQSEDKERSGRSDRALVVQQKRKTQAKPTLQEEDAAIEVEFVEAVKTETSSASELEPGFGHHVKLKHHLHPHTKEMLPSNQGDPTTEQTSNSAVATEPDERLVVSRQQDEDLCSTHLETSFNMDVNGVGTISDGEPEHVESEARTQLAPLRSLTYDHKPNSKSEYSPPEDRLFIAKNPTSREATGVVSASKVSNVLARHSRSNSLAPLLTCHARGGAGELEKQKLKSWTVGPPRSVISINKKGWLVASNKMCVKEVRSTNSAAPQLEQKKVQTQDHQSRDLVQTIPIETAFSTASWDCIPTKAAHEVLVSLKRGKSGNSNDPLKSPFLSLSHESKNMDIMFEPGICKMYLGTAPVLIESASSTMLLSSNQGNANGRVDGHNGVRLESSVTTEVTSRADLAFSSGLTALPGQLSPTKAEPVSEMMITGNTASITSSVALAYWELLPVKAAPGVLIRLKTVKGGTPIQTIKRRYFPYRPNGSKNLEILRYEPGISKIPLESASVLVADMSVANQVSSDQSEVFLNNKVCSQHSKAKAKIESHQNCFKFESCATASAISWAACARTSCSIPSPGRLSYGQVPPQLITGNTGVVGSAVTLAHSERLLMKEVPEILIRLKKGNGRMPTFKLKRPFLSSLDGSKHMELSRYEPGILRVCGRLSSFPLDGSLAASQLSPHKAKASVASGYKRDNFESLASMATTSLAGSYRTPGSISLPDKLLVSNLPTKLELFSSGVPVANNTVTTTSLVSMTCSKHLPANAASGILMRLESGRSSTLKRPSICLSKGSTNVIGFSSKLAMSKKRVAFMISLVPTEGSLATRQPSPHNITATTRVENDLIHGNDSLSAVTTITSWEDLALMPTLVSLPEHLSAKTKLVMLTEATVAGSNALIATVIFTTNREYLLPPTTAPGILIQRGTRAGKTPNNARMRRFISAFDDLKTIALLKHEPGRACCESVRMPSDKICQNEDKAAVGKHDVNFQATVRTKSKPALTSLSKSSKTDEPQFSETRIAVSAAPAAAQMPCRHRKTIATPGASTDSKHRSHKELQLECPTPRSVKLDFTIGVDVKIYPGEELTCAKRPLRTGAVILAGLLFTFLLGIPNALSKSADSIVAMPIEQLQSNILSVDHEKCAATLSTGMGTSPSHSRDEFDASFSNSSFKMRKGALKDVDNRAQSTAAKERSYEDEPMPPFLREDYFDDYKSTKLHKFEESSTSTANKEMHMAKASGLPFSDVTASLFLNIQITAVDAAPEELHHITLPSLSLDVKKRQLRRPVEQYHGNAQISANEAHNTKESMNYTTQDRNVSLTKETSSFRNTITPQLSRRMRGNAIASLLRILFVGKGMASNCKKAKVFRTSGSRTDKHEAVPSALENEYESHVRESMAIRSGFFRDPVTILLRRLFLNDHMLVKANMENSLSKGTGDSDVFANAESQGPREGQANGEFSGDLISRMISGISLNSHLLKPDRVVTITIVDDDGPIPMEYGQGSSTRASSETLA